MKTDFKTASVAAAAAVLGAFLSFTTAHAVEPSAPPVAQDSTTPPVGNTQFNDAEILGWVLVLDSNELAAGQLAATKKISPKVKAYAKMLREQHREDLKATKKLAGKLKVVPVSNPVTDGLRSKGAQELAALSSKDGAEFETAYLDAMVQGHSEALTAIDGELLPKSVAKDTKKHLTELRKHVEKHLEHGKHLQGAAAPK